MSGKRVLVVAWSAADWSVIHPAIDRGELPHLASLVENGVSGPLATLAPLKIPIVATTLATGFHPPRHGVLEEVEPRVDGGGVEPTGRRSWRAPALWEYLASAGLRTAVVNWPATAPADRWPGVMVDSTFAASEGSSFDAWPLPPHCVAPDRLRTVMRDLRVHPGDIGPAELRALIPRLEEIDGRSDRRPHHLAVALARSATVHAAATHIAEQEQWDFLLVHYSLLVDVWRAIQAAPDAGETYHDAWGGAYRLLDVMLGRLKALAGPNVLTFLVAAAGWRSAGVRIQESDDDALIASDRGMLVAQGEGIERDALIHHARAVDLAPTLLACFGLAVPSDGMVLDDLFPAGAPPTQPVPPTPRPAAPVDDPALHLVALGYADRLDNAAKLVLAETELAKERNLANAHLALHQWDGARTVLARILERLPNDYLAHLKMGRIALLAGDAGAALSHAGAALAARPELPWADLLMGTAHAKIGDAATAEPHLARARQLGAGVFGVHLALGWAGVLLQRWKDAEIAFRDALAADSTMADARTGLGISLHAQGRTEEGETELRRAIGLCYVSPMAHFHLGQIALRRGALEEASASLRLAIVQNPGLDEARGMLLRVEKMMGKSVRGSESTQSKSRSF